MISGGPNLWIASFNASTQKSASSVFDIRQASQHLPGVPVHDGDQIKEAPAHGQVGDVGAPDLIWPLYPQSTQQMGVGLVPLCRSAGIGFLIDRHQAHQPHQPPDALVIHSMATVLQVPRHLLHAVKRCLKELFVDHHHEVQVDRRLAHQFLVKR